MEATAIVAGTSKLEAAQKLVDFSVTRKLMKCTMKVMQLLPILA